MVAPGALDGPWFAPWREDGHAVLLEMRQGAALHDALNIAGRAPVHFVPADELPSGTPYERYVFETRRCPVREGTHDFFNGLAWRRFPHAKTQLNAVHAEQIRLHGIPPVRGAIRDAATLFDENGAILSAPTALWEALAQRNWRALFVELRPLWREANFVIFGHALLEKLLAPRKDLTAHVLSLPCPQGSLGKADEWLAGELTPERLAAKPFLPLPVLGIPGWSALNEDFSFYDDARIFRPAGRQETGPAAPRTTQPSAPPRA
ncbi:MAG: DUF3025 domain-containing protein [Pseudomonadota bacterium]